MKSPPHLDHSGNEEPTAMKSPLHLEVLDHRSFETWLCDSDYLEVLDHRSSSAAVAVDAAVENPSSSSTAAALTGGFFASCLTLNSLLTLNPLAKLSMDYFARPTLSWTGSFFTDYESYSFPSSPNQAHLRAHENVKCYVQNYASLFTFFFTCTL